MPSNAAEGERPLPVLLDTDIGTDIDDAYALVLAATAPELDLRAVTTVGGNTFTRAEIALKLLKLLGHSAPVAVGSGVPLGKVPWRGWDGYEGEGLDLSDVSWRRDAHPLAAPHLIADLAETAHAEGRPLTFLAIGPLTNLALALQLHPEATRQLAQVVWMGANFQGFGPENARAEHNVACDPLAAEVVLQSGLHVTVVGYNVGVQTRLGRADLGELWELGGPLGDALAGLHEVWFRWTQRDHSPMYDPLTVLAAFREDLIETVPTHAHVDLAAPEPGTVVFGPGVEDAPHRVATHLDLPRFQEMQRERLRRAVPGRGGTP
ncbi:nucleoside hydrolase (plasmid) [Deinococcus aetherius]|uniref:Nucleoside hydrolase n=1 Tax=Deinococcus aetherius TaxID=200252 RepID=A0ABM8AJE2_9DEIO|nr:nucleoside hydrolase [Deinococcus aetherius]BDP43936.1 nucleoside hydrolase [Deinococcus aetherius]